VFLWMLEQLAVEVDAGASLIALPTVVAVNEVRAMEQWCRCASCLLVMNLSTCV
jgi:hypothetical protein